jgi:ribosome biogenesis protein ERB1
MAALDVKPRTKKRKQAYEDAEPPAELSNFSAPVESLEMLSDEEGPEDDAASDDGQVDRFPEIDAASDSEEEGSFGDEEDEEDSEGTDEEDFEEENSDDSLDRDIFPKPKTIISDITGHPKRVYPEIEPDYDSDSSTEDVSVQIHGL